MQKYFPSSQQQNMAFKHNYGDTGNWLKVNTVIGFPFDTLASIL